MQTIILAAGEGTRMRPLTRETPKPLLPVADRPLVAHTADAAITAGASRLVFVIGYQASTVKEYFGSEYRGTPVEYATQDEQDGTAHAVRAATETLDPGAFAVLNGDILLDQPSVSSLFEAGPAVGSIQVETPTSYGVLDCDEGGSVVGVIEKPADPPSNLINTGAYVFPAAARDWMDVTQSDRGEQELTDVLQRSCRETDVSAVPFERWLDVGRPWDLLSANEWTIAEMDRSIDGSVSDRTTLRGAVVVEKGATVREGVTIEGPAILRTGASVGPNAYIRGATLLGPDVHVGHSVEIKNSILREGATVGHLSYVGDSVLGQNVNFGAGTTVANLRHDNAPVETTLKGERVSTGRRKYGVVVGDGVKTGIDTSLNAGVVLAGGVRTAPDETVMHDRTE